MTISVQVAEVFKLFEELEQAFNDSESVFSLMDPKSMLAEELGRFRIWSGNIGAHKTGRSSLDFRLREHPKLERTVGKLLEDLRGTLEDALSIVSGTKTPWDDISDDDSLDSTDCEGNEDASLADSPESETGGIVAETELQQLQGDIAEIITCLLRFSMTIRNPVSNAKFTRAAKVDKSGFEPYDIRHVENKFPAADEYLVLRLGKAITRRRRYLTYREEHHEKLESGLTETARAHSGKVSEQDGQTQIRQLSTVASSLPMAFLDGSTVDEDIDQGSEAGHSETSFASSVDENSKLVPPRLPTQALSEQPYQCPICYMIIDIHTSVAWRRHVFKDLHPYSCTSENCTTADTLFERRSEWFNHELKLHRRMWQCLQGCSQTFTEKDQFEAHLRLSHPYTFNEDQLPAIMEMSESQVSADHKDICPLCKEEITSLKQFRRHLGRHQEQLALFALPLSIKEGEDPDQDTDESDKNSNSTDATVEAGIVSKPKAKYAKTYDSDARRNVEKHVESLLASDNSVDSSFTYKPTSENVAETQPFSLPSEKIPPDCAICNAPAYPACTCESEKVRAAVIQEEKRFIERGDLRGRNIMHLEEQLPFARDLVLKEARRDILAIFEADVMRRTTAYREYIAALPNFDEHLREGSKLSLTLASQLRSQIREAHAELGRGISVDWRKAVQQYPELLQKYYGKVVLADGKLIFLPNKS